MVNYFRNIRKIFAEENKPMKYLRYAIGEIVLVVIGILIALQINNWNEKQKNIKNEAELLTSLEKEILGNIKQLEAVKAAINTFKMTSNKVLEKLDSEASTFTTEEIRGVFNYYGAIIDSPILDEIIASNSTKLINRKDLIIDLRDLQYSYQKIEKSEYYLDELWNSKITDFFISCGLPFESYSSNDPLITIKDIEQGGYSTKQFKALINMKNDLQKYWETRQETAYIKSKELLNQLK